jgi:hypothetical protein
MMERGTLFAIRSNWRAISASSISSGPSSSTDSNVEIPQVLESRATLDFLGFSDEAGDEVWDRYSNACTTHPDMVDLLEFAVAYVDSGQDAVDGTDDWERAMQSMGVGATLRERIMTPGHDTIRLSRSAKQWVIETMADLWLWLSTLGRTIEETEAERAITSASTQTDRVITPAGPASFAIRGNCGGRARGGRSSTRATPRYVIIRIIINLTDGLHCLEPGRSVRREYLHCWSGLARCIAHLRSGRVRDNR